MGAWPGATRARAAARWAMFLAALGLSSDRTPQHDSSLRLPRTGGVDVAIDARGARIRVGGADVRFDARALARVRAPRETGFADVAPTPSNEGARLARAESVTEWWKPVNGGVEHGFELHARPPGAGDVVVTVDIGGDLQPSLIGRAVVLGRAGRSVARYDALHVLDANARELPAHFELFGSRLHIVFDDANALYPIVVDPMLHGLEQKLLAPDKQSSDNLGHRVAMTGDGTRLVVGAYVGPGDTGFSGAQAGQAYVFVRGMAGWTLEQRLVSPNARLGERFGASVSISDDGARVAIGAVGATDATPTSTLGNGAVYVFARAGATWTFEQKLLASDKADNDQLGTSVTISADGSRVASGAPYHTDTSGTTTAGCGAVYVYARTGTTWTQEAELVAADKAANDYFGVSVESTDDGATLVVGAPYADEASAPAAVNGGAAYVFDRVGSTWSQTAELLASDRATNDYLGSSVSVSGDGTRFAFGSPSESNSIGRPTVGNGAVYVFARSGSTFTLEQKLFANDKSDYASYGNAVDLDVDGTDLVVGSSMDSPLSTYLAGSAYHATRSGTVWSETQKLVANDLAASDYFGDGIAVTDDGALLAVGASGEDDATGTTTTDNGAVYLFALGALGAPCGGSGDCLSGSCVDGVCCDSPCGGGAPDDCMACSHALTGVGEGTCAPLSSTAAAAVTCRPVVGGCDVAETCVTGTTACPGDVLASASTPCRPSAGVCDPGEVCDGFSGACPNDVRSVGDLCRPAAGPCDVDDRCDGIVPGCPSDARVPSGTTCRPSSDTCDLAEVCNGVDSTCPGDTFAGRGTQCRAAVGPCDVGESCTGASAACPADRFRPTSWTCRAQAGLCDLAETCDGTSAACPANAWAPDGAACDDGLACTQSSACQTGVCASSATIDCSDADPCTVDTCAEPSGCTHASSSACGVDTGVDASSDASQSADASAPPDTGPPTPTGAGGCACHVAAARPRSESSTIDSLGWIGLLAVLRRRRRNSIRTEASR